MTCTSLDPRQATSAPTSIPCWYFSALFESLRVIQHLSRSSTSVISNPSCSSMPTNLLFPGDESCVRHKVLTSSKAAGQRVGTHPAWPYRCPQCFLVPSPRHNALRLEGECGVAVFSLLGRNPTFSSKLQTSFYILESMKEHNKLTTLLKKKRKRKRLDFLTAGYGLQKVFLTRF